MTFHNDLILIKSVFNKDQTTTIKYSRKSSLGIT